MPAISVVVPCYQEADALGPWGDLLPRLAADELVFVDDGSTDATPRALAALAAADPRVRIATHGANRGVGAATRTGLALATGDVVVVYDADRTYPPETIDLLVASVRAGADLATASPWTPGAEAGDVTPFRAALSRAAAAAYRAVLGPRSHGTRTFTCATRAYRRAWARRLLPREDGFPAAAEMLGRALLLGARVVEVPARLGRRTEGESKMRVLRALSGHLRVLTAFARARAGSRRRGTGGPTE